MNVIIILTRSGNQHVIGVINSPVFGHFYLLIDFVIPKDQILSPKLFLCVNCLILKKSKKQWNLVYKILLRLQVKLPSQG